MDEMLTDSALSEAVEEAPQPDEKIEVIGIKFRENGRNLPLWYGTYC